MISYNAKKKVRVRLGCGFACELRYAVLVILLTLLSKRSLMFLATIISMIILLSQ